MEIKDGQAVSGFGQFFDAAKDLTNFTATWEGKTPRSDWVAAKEHYDQRLPAQPGDVSDYILWGTKHFNKPRSLISLSVFSMTSFPAFLRWVSTLIPWTVASLSPWTHTIGSQESFFVLDTGPSDATPCDSSSWAQAITHLIHFSLPSGWDCAGWERLDFASLNHSCLPTSLPPCLLVFAGCCVIMSFLFWWTSSPPCHVNFAELLLYSQI